MSEFVIPWQDLNTYLKEAEERIIGAMAESANEKDLWREQGKLLLVRELLNLKAIFEATAMPPNAPLRINPSLLTRERWAKDHGISVGKGATG